MMSDKKYHDWQNAIKKDKVSNKKMMLTLKDSENLVQDISNKFRADDGSTLITYAELLILPFDVWFPVNKGVRYKRVFHPQKPLFFHTEMKPKLTDLGIAEFGLQDHDCKEVCKIITGHLIETLERNKEYIKGESVIYPPYYMHKPAAKVYSFYEVEFIKSGVNLKRELK